SPGLVTFIPNSCGGARLAFRFKSPGHLRSDSGKRKPARAQATLCNSTIFCNKVADIPELAGIGRPKQPMPRSLLSAGTHSRRCGFPQSAETTSQRVGMNLSVLASTDLAALRICIEDVYPSVDAGRFAVKRVAGEPVDV